MATKTVIVDDLDPEQTADETVDFALDGVSYTIDLTNDHAAELRKALSDFIAVSRQVGKAKGSRIGHVRSTGATSGTKGETAAVRAWAQANGYKVADRGRIHADVVEAYNNRDVTPPTSELVHTAETSAREVEPVERVTESKSVNVVTPLFSAEPPATPKTSARKTTARATTAKAKAKATTTAK